MRNEARVFGKVFGLVGLLAAAPGAPAQDCSDLPIHQNSPPVGPEYRVDDLVVPSAYDVYYPQIAADASGRVVHLWLEGLYANPSSHRILCKASFDYGASVAATAARVDGTPAPYGFWDLALAMDNNAHVYAVWKFSTSYSGGVQVWFSRSSDGGVTWEPDRRIDQIPTSVSMPSPVRVAADDTGHVYVVWSDARTGRWRIYLQRSGDHGATWQIADQRVDHNDTTGNRSEAPELAIGGGGYVYVVWQDNRQSANSIYFNRSSDYGATFQPQDIHVDSLPPGSAYLVESPVIAAGDDGGVYVAWLDLRSGNYQARFSRSNDFGLTFGTDQRIDHGDPGIHVVPVRIAGDDFGNVYAAFSRAAPGPYINVSKLFFNASHDHGATWGGTDTRIDASPDTHHARFAKIGCDNAGRVFLTWIGEAYCYPPCANAQDVFWRTSGDFGRTFQPALRLDGAPANTNQGGVMNMAVGACGIAHASWQDNRHNAGVGDPLVNLYTRSFAAPSVCNRTRGDTNCDGRIDGDDINPFVLALFDPFEYSSAFPTCDLCTADLNGDGAVDGLDIPPFVECLLNAGCP